MIRRISAQALLFSIIILCVSSAASQGLPGRDYTVLDPPRGTRDPNRIVVTEFFSYQCPHCYAFHPAWKAWARTLPEDVVLERQAVAIGRPQWEPTARAFYALDAMNEIDALDDALFAAIHVDGIALLDEASLTAWVSKQGIGGAEFVEMYGGFGIGTRVARAERLARDVRIPGVPTLLIDGRYVVPIAANRPFDVQLELVDRLIDAARAQRR